MGKAGGNIRAGAVQKNQCKAKLVRLCAAAFLRSRQNDPISRGVNIRAFLGSDHSAGGLHTRAISVGRNRPGKCSQILRRGQASFAAFRQRNKIFCVYQGFPQHDHIAGHAFQRSASRQGGKRSKNKQQCRSNAREGCGKGIGLAAQRTNAACKLFSGYRKGIAAAAAHFCKLQQKLCIAFSLAAVHCGGHRMVTADLAGILQISLHQPDKRAEPMQHGCKLGGCFDPKMHLPNVRGFVAQHKLQSTF